MKLLADLLAVALLSACFGLTFAAVAYAAGGSGVAINTAAMLGFVSFGGFGLVRSVLGEQA